MSLNYVVGIGAANVDINGKSINPLIMKDSNPGYMNVSVGGVTRNVLENISRIGYPTKIITTIGNDAYGAYIKDKSEQAGIDFSNALVVNNCPSSSYLSILNSNGDMHLALSDMHIIKNLSVKYLESKNDLITNSSLIVIDPCLSQSEDLIPYICEKYGKDKPIFCDPVSCGYALKIKPYLKYIHTIKPNEMELEILSDHSCKTIEEKIESCKILIDKGIKQVFVSLGKDGCLYYDIQGICIQKSFKETKMVNATGAGDAFMAAIIYSYVNKFDIQKTLDYALACGIIAISSKDTINLEMSLDKIKEIIRKERG